MKLSARQINLVLILLSCLALVFTFVGRADPYSPRSLHAAWNTGHVAAFFLWILLFLRLFPTLTGNAFTRRLLLCAGLALVAGTLIECIQSLFNREVSFLDIGNDVMGALLAAAIINEATIRPGKTRRVVLIAALCLVTAMLNYTLFIYLFDEMMARKQFPVLADFSSPLQLTRFGGNAKHDLVHHEDRDFMRFELGTEQYSGFAFKNFPRDWSPFTSLSLRLENPESEPLKITCRIHDRRHSDGNEEYSDRFNRSYELLPGENRLIIPLEDVINAPETRTLDLRQVGGLGCFSINLPVARTLYLHEIRLLP